MNVSRFHFIAQVLKSIKKKGKQILSIESAFLLKKLSYLNWLALFSATKTRKLFQKPLSQSKWTRWRDFHAPNYQVVKKSFSYILSLTDFKMFSSFEEKRLTKGFSVSSELKKLSRDFRPVRWLKMDRIANCVFTLGLESSRFIKRFKSLSQKYSSKNSKDSRFVIASGLLFVNSYTFY